MSLWSAFGLGPNNNNYKNIPSSDSGLTDHPAFWEVDLGALHVIMAMQLYNRMEGEDDIRFG